MESYYTMKSRLFGLLLCMAVFLAAMWHPALADQETNQPVDSGPQVPGVGAEETEAANDAGTAPAEPMPEESGPALEEVVADKAMAEAVEDDLDYALSLMAGTGQEFDPSRVADIVALVLARKEDPSDFNPKERGDATSAYGQITVNVGLDRLLSYMFNPNLPSYVAIPSLVRLGGWRDGQEAKRVLSGIWNRMPFETPTIFRGTEYEVTTPSLEVGSFYAYDLNRALVFFNYKGRNALLSLTRMANESEVGKKGIAVGDPDTWVYFYSESPGSMSGLADMVDTYIYDSISVNLFIEAKPGANRVVIGMFKWLKAGGGIFKDMVGEDDIRGGMDDYRDIIKSVLESPNLPSTLAIRDYTTRLKGLTDSQLRELLRPFSEELVRLAEQGGDMADGDFAELIKDGRYMESLTREEMESEIIKRYLYAKLHNLPPEPLPEPEDSVTGDPVEPVEGDPIHLVPELYENGDPAADPTAQDPAAQGQTAPEGDTTSPEEASEPVNQQ